MCFDHETGTSLYIDGYNKVKIFGKMPFCGRETNRQTASNSARKRHKERVSIIILGRRVEPVKINGTYLWPDFVSLRQTMSLGIFRLSGNYRRKKLVQWRTCFVRLSRKRALSLISPQGGDADGGRTAWWQLVGKPRAAYVAVAGWPTATRRIKKTALLYG